MCGRYAAGSRPEDLIEELEIEVDLTGDPSRSILAGPQSPPAGQPDYNMAPTKRAPIVLTRSPQPHQGSAAVAEDPARPARPMRQLRLLTWGLVPSWAKDVKVGLRMTNARAETLLDKPSFAKAAMSRRCLVPADGWYEWQLSPVATDAKGKPRKQPFFMRRVDDQPLTIAGVYEFWRDHSLATEDPDAWLTTFAIITTAAEEGLDRIHDRQPLILDRDRWADWLDPTVTDPDEVRDQLQPAAPGRFEAWPISLSVNATRNNGPQLLEPIGRDQLVGVIDPSTGEIIGGQ